MQIELSNRKKWKTRVEFANAIFDYIEIFLGPSTPAFNSGVSHPDRVRVTLPKRHRPGLRLITTSGNQAVGQVILIPKIYEGIATKKIVDQFRGLVSKAVSQYINDQVNDRLKTALGEDIAPFAGGSGGGTVGTAGPTPTVPAAPAEEAEPAAEVDPGIVTTEEAIEAFNIIRVIDCSEVELERVGYRDSKSYCAVLLDDHNRNPSPACTSTARPPST